MQDKEKAILKKRLDALKIKDGQITEIKFLEAQKGGLTMDGMAMNDTPAHCEVYATLTPTKNSDIKIVVSLPLENWNGRFLGIGNGGGAGTLDMQRENAGVARFFATANTDMGTSPWEKVVGNPDRWEDFGNRSTHLMTVVGKQITEAFYDKKISYSYFSGGSTGGCQALMEAQRYPDDYDGIAAYCPAYNRVNLHQEFMWILHCTCDDPEKLFSPEQMQAVKKRILDKLAIKSGSAPGDEFISYPGKAEITPQDVPQFFEGLGLSEKQLKVISSLLTFPLIPGTDKPIYVSMPLECIPQCLGVPYIKDGFIKMLGFLQDWVFGFDYPYATYDFEKDYLKMCELLRDKCDATNPDLSEFKAAGHKMLMFTGSCDSLIPYKDGENYYKAVIDKMGGLDNVTDFFRYFHIPGMAHCSGGPGLQEIGNNIGLRFIPCDEKHDALEALIAWRENGVFPDTLLPVAIKDAAKENTVSFDEAVPTPLIGGKEIDFERPVYPYPFETEYIGGDRKDKKSFRKKLGDGNY